MGATPPDAQSGPFIRLRNATVAPIEHVLEPWGDMFELRPGKTLTLLPEGSNADYLEVVFEEGRVTTWSDAGSTVSVLEGDGARNASHPSRPAVPPYPAGVRRRQPPEARPGVHRIELVLINAGHRPLTLSVLAQGARYTLDPQDTHTVASEIEPLGMLVLDLHEDLVVVHG